MYRIARFVAATALLWISVSGTGAVETEWVTVGDLGNAVAAVGNADCNENQIPDACDIECGVAGGTCDLVGCGESHDCDTNGVPDECQPDSDTDGVVDACDDCSGTILDANVDGVGCPMQIPGDADRDGDVDLHDAQDFQNCYVLDVSAECLVALDPDDDGDADLDDWAGIGLGVGGPGIPQSPAGMVPIPAGSFRMGDAFEEGLERGGPVHSVYLSPFYIDKYELANGQYAAALNEWALVQGGMITVTEGVVYQAGSGISYPYCDTTTSSPYGEITWNGSTFDVVAGKEDHPIVVVSWYGAVAFCNWRSAMEGKPLCYDLSTWTCDFGVAGYRLPTEAEWAKAAGWNPAQQRHYRFGEQTDGCGFNCADAQRVNYATSGDPFEVAAEPRTTPVGYYDGSNHGGYQSQNAQSYYGCYDMSGNVWEWCYDWFGFDYFNTPEATQPNPVGPDSSTFRILRGGSWDKLPNRSRSAHRDGGRPDARRKIYGLRCALGTP